MTRLEWDNSGTRLYEVGVDRGVLFRNDIAGVPWVGLISVEDKPVGGGFTPYYMDGIKYYDRPSVEDLAGSIEAFTSPEEFDRCDGTYEIEMGISITQQKREPFGLSYRTKIGNDLDGPEHGYKIHLIYDSLASPTQRVNDTISSSITPLVLSWDFVSKPRKVLNSYYTSHLILDSRKINPYLLYEVENLIDGTNTTDPRLPDPSEILSLLKDAVYKYIVPREDTGLAELEIGLDGYLAQSGISGVYTALPNSPLRPTSTPGVYSLE